MSLINAKREPSRESKSFKDMHWIADSIRELSQSKKSCFEVTTMKQMGREAMQAN